MAWGTQSVPHPSKNVQEGHALVFPAASRPNINRRISLDPKILAMIFDTEPPIAPVCRRCARRCDYTVRRCEILPMLCDNFVSCWWSCVGVYQVGSSLIAATSTSDRVRRLDGEFEQCCVGDRFETEADDPGCEMRSGGIVEIVVLPGKWLVDPRRWK